MERRLNIPAHEIIDSEDLLSTNKFSQNLNKRDIPQADKEKFKRYYTSQRPQDPTADLQQGILIKKESQKTIKTERISVIDIDTRNVDKNRYPQPSSFVLPLGKTFYNIKTIELVNTSIPNTDQTITENPIEIRNNRISWQNEEDRDLGIVLASIQPTDGDPDKFDIIIENHGQENQVRLGNFYVKISGSTSTPSVDGERYCEIIDSNTLRVPFVGGIAATATGTVDLGFPIYTVTLTAGNYNATSLATEIQTKLNLVKRRNQTGLIFHYFTVEVNLDTDVMTFSSYITKQLPTNPIDSSVGSGILTVNAQNHGFKTGDYMLMIGAKSTGGLNNQTLNGLFQVTTISKDVFTYEVNDRASIAQAGGGSSIKIGTPSNFRLMYHTAKSLIVNNIGYADEDSSETLDANPITTKVIKPDSITHVPGTITFTCLSHGLQQNNSVVVDSISVGVEPTVTTATDHGIKSEQVYLFYQHSDPPFNGVVPIIVTGNNSFRLQSVQVLSTTVGTGIVKHGGDTIKLAGIKTIPVIEDKVLLVENVTTDTFEVKVTVDEIDDDTISDTIIRTEQITVKKTAHKFNSISSIVAQGTKALITTKTHHNLNGKKFENATLETTAINTIDIETVVEHNLATNDTINITGSNTSPNVDGTYLIQVIDSLIFRISYTGGLTNPGTATINTGDTVVFSNTDCVPSLTTNALGNPLFWINKVDDISFYIDITLTQNGSTGTIGRDNSFSLYRLESDVKGSSDIGGIPLAVLNHQYFDITDILDEDTFMFRCGNYATKTVTGGGVSAKISSQKHGLRKFQANTTDGTSSSVLYKSISLEGENYLYLCSEGLGTVYSPGNEKVGDIFAKLILDQQPGKMCFDSFISAPKMFNPPMGVLKELAFDIRRYDGYLFNFNNTDISFAVRVTEIVDQIRDSNMSSRTGTSDLY